MSLASAWLLICSNICRSRHRGLFKAFATISLVMSSSVEPSPPVATTKRDVFIAFLRASETILKSSPTDVIRITLSPEAVSLPAAYQAFRLSVRPEVSSLPIVIISPCMTSVFILAQLFRHRWIYIQIIKSMVTHGLILTDYVLSNKKRIILTHKFA